ncbi:hypothetical protein E4U53_005024 [Claviceps sorghi]|nr:hypothetical protein E4U53_005024 [Claviceps sorghi]
MRTHSFQIVGLQNQIQELQNAKSRQEEDAQRVREELLRSRGEIAYLKGRLAGLTVDFYSTATGTKDQGWEDWSGRNRHQDSGAESSPDAKHGASPPVEVGILEDGTVGASHAAGLVADQLWNEQRPGLIKALENYCQARHPAFHPARDGSRDVHDENVSQKQEEDR